MALFGSRKKKADWFCITVQPDRVDVCHVQARGRARPEVVVCDSYRKEGDDAQTLRRLRRELRLDRHRCTTLLREGEYRLLQVDAPANVPAQEARSAVRWQIRELVDFPVEEAAVDSVFVPSADGAGARAQQMLVVAAKRSIVAAGVRPFTESDIELDAVDVPDFAQRNLARLMELPGRALALLSLDEHNGLLTFTADGELYQSRRIDVSLRAFEGADDERRKRLYDRLVLELQRSLDHFDRQFRHLAVARIMVTPVPGAGDLREYLAANLDVPVALVHLPEILDFPHVPELHDEARQAQCLRLIGAALRNEEAAAA